MLNLSVLSNACGEESHMFIYRWFDRGMLDEINKLKELRKAIQEKNTTGQTSYADYDNDIALIKDIRTVLLRLNQSDVFRFLMGADIELVDWFDYYFKNREEYFGSAVSYLASAPLTNYRAFTSYLEYHGTMDVLKALVMHLQSNSDVTYVDGRIGLPHVIPKAQPIRDMYMDRLKKAYIEVVDSLNQPNKNACDEVRNLLDSEHDSMFSGLWRYLLSYSPKGSTSLGGLFKNAEG